MSAKIAEQMTPMFAGEIWESDADVPMGKGYANDGQPFNINTAFYLMAVFIAIRNPAFLKVIIKAAVQTLKTYVLERSTVFFARHDPGDMTFYDCDLDAAKDHAKSRVGPLLKSIPGLAAQFAEVEKDNRHDITTTEFYLPGMTLRFWPLNESSTQRITLRRVFISDAFLSKNTGMLKQAIARTTQHPLDKKIIIESQGSDEGDDFDREFLETSQHLCRDEARDR
jgi:phage terminase large subunit GpA-like protein